MSVLDCPRPYCPHSRILFYSVLFYRSILFLLIWGHRQDNGVENQQVSGICGIMDVYLQLAHYARKTLCLMISSDVLPMMITKISNDNNNNSHDNVCGAVIMTKLSLREFTRFI